MENLEMMNVAFEELKNFYSGKKVLVTGHTGFKGSYLTVLLGMLGASVYGYSLPSPTDPSLFDIIYGKSCGARPETELFIKTKDRFSSVKGVEESKIGDIRDFDLFNDYYQRIRPDIVLHLAAQPIVREAYRIPRETYEINVLGTVNVLEAVRLNPFAKSVLNVTTDKVYENNGLKDHAFKEDEKLDGYDPYSNSKSCSDIVTHSYASSFLNAVGVAVSTARAGNVIGGGDFSLDRIIPDCVRAAVSGKNIAVRNPYSIRPYQFVLEPLTAYLIIAMRQYEDSRFAGQYNIGPEETDCITTGELCDIFVRAYGNGIKWINESQENAPHEAAYLKLDSGKMKRTFGWTPTWNIERAVFETVNWTKAWEKSNEDANEEMLRIIRDFFAEFN